MTPSLVGYLCSNCGNTQRFYTDSGVMPANPSPMPVHISNPLPSQATEASNKVSSDNKLQSTLKRLMVPELPPPHSHVQANNYVDSISNPASPSGIVMASDIDPTGNETPAQASSTSTMPATVNSKSSLWIWVSLVLILLLAAGIAAYFITTGN